MTADVVQATAYLRLLHWLRGLAFVALSMVCLLSAPGRIEADIQRRAELELALFPWASVLVDGRTAYLRGSIGRAGDQGWALKRLEAVAGVRCVVDQTRLAGSTSIRNEGSG